MRHKGKNSSFDKHQLVIFHYEKDKSYREIGKLINLSKSSRYCKKILFMKIALNQYLKKDVQNYLTHGINAKLLGK